MPNVRYLNQAVAKAAAAKAHATQDPRGAFEAWAADLTDAQLQGAFTVLVEEKARRAGLDPETLRRILEVVRALE